MDSARLNELAVDIDLLLETAISVINVGAGNNVVLIEQIVDSSVIRFQSGLQ